MNYADAVVYLKEHDIKKDDGTYYEFGEVSGSVRLRALLNLSNPVNSCGDKWD